MTVPKKLTIEHLDIFDKELKKFSKNHKHIYEDLELFKNTQLKLSHIEKIDNRAIFHLNDTSINNPLFFKVKKFRSRDFLGKGVKSGIRLIYAFYPEEMKVEFIQIYYKEKHDTDYDKNRIKNHYG